MFGVVFGLFVGLLFDCFFVVFVALSLLVEVVSERLLLCFVDDV